MFVKAVKFNRKTAVFIIIASAAVIAAIILIAGKGSSGASPRSQAAKTNQDRVDYLAACGWEVEAEPVREQSVIIPREMDGVIAEYNELQKQQGFDLAEYGGLELEMYCYRVTNYPNCSDEVWASLYIYNNRVVGGDIHSTAMDGFMHGLK